MKSFRNMDTVTDRIVSFDPDIIRRDTERIFMRSGSRAKDEKKAAKIGRRMSEVFDALKDQINPCSVLSYYDSSHMSFSGKVISVNGISFECNAFEKIDPGMINGVFAYFISAGNYDRCEMTSLSDRLIIDMLGTAIVSAARMQMQKYLKEEADLSEDFGPGLYGMDVHMMHQLSHLADASLAGIRIKDSGMLVPVKSCGVICFDVAKDYVPLSIACRDCLGTSGSCSLCLVGRQ